MRHLRLLLKAWLAAWLVFALGSRASAQTSAADRASAQALFDEGKQLLEDGQPAAACPKLEESLKLDAAIGTRYQLAKCYELTSRSASAWTLYLEVAAEARAAGQGAREEFARKQAQKLEPELSYLTIVVPTEARAQGLTVTRNGVALGRGSWNAKLPVDPGRYTIVAKAPGKKEWQGAIEVNGPKGSESIAIPQLEEAPPEAKKPEPAQASGSSQTPRDTGTAPSNGRLTTRHWVGIGLAGAGVIALGAGGVFALRAKKLNDESGCNNGNCPTEGALDDNHDARRAGDVATVLGIAGGALVLGGVAVFFAPVGGASETAVVPALGPGMAGLEVTRSF